MDRTALNISVLVCFYDFWLPVANETPLQAFASFDNFMASNPRKEPGSTQHTYLGCMHTLGSHQRILQWFKTIYLIQAKFESKYA